MGCPKAEKYPLNLSGNSERENEPTNYFKSIISANTHFAN